MTVRDTSSGTGLAGCGCWIIALIVNLAVGGWSVNYLLSVFAHKIPFIWATVIGLFTAELTLPAAIVVLILKKFGGECCGLWIIFGLIFIAFVMSRWAKNVIEEPKSPIIGGNDESKD